MRIQHSSVSVSPFFFKTPVPGNPFLQVVSVCEVVGLSGTGHTENVTRAEALCTGTLGESLGACHLAISQCALRRLQLGSGSARESLWSAFIM